MSGLRSACRRVHEVLPLRRVLGSMRRWMKANLDYCKWSLSGRKGNPPHRYKVDEIRRIARAYRCRSFVETGTYYGDTTWAVMDLFDRSFTIELDDALHELAVRRFADRPQVRVLHGDSGEVLPSLLDELVDPALYWLDGHYSGGVTAKGSLDTPIMKELDAIMTRGGTFVVLIDDARLFDGTHDYPKLEDLIDSVGQRLGDAFRIEVACDVIRILPIGETCRSSRA